MSTSCVNKETTASARYRVCLEIELGAQRSIRASVGDWKEQRHHWQSSRTDVVIVKAACVCAVQVGDADCYRAVTIPHCPQDESELFICSPGSQRGAKERKRRRRKKERRRRRGGGETGRACRLPAAHFQHLNDYTHTRLSSWLVLLSLLPYLPFLFFLLLLSLSPSPLSAPRP